MATHLDLEEQEQLDQLKSFWKQYGNLITWVLILALGGFAAWNGWNRWQQDQGEKAGSMFDELERAAQSGNVDSTSRIFADIKERYPRTAFAQQAGLVAARLEVDKGKADAARASLAWVAESATEAEYRSIARLRLAGILLDDKKYDEALKQLEAVDGNDFAALADDRRGDILLAQGKTDGARAAYQKAFAAMDSKVDYRRILEAKLNVLGVPASSEPAATAGSAAASGMEPGK